MKVSDQHTNIHECNRFITLNFIGYNLPSNPQLRRIELPFLIDRVNETSKVISME